jgi:hypothetical protein
MRSHPGYHLLRQEKRQLGDLIWDLKNGAIYKWDINTPSGQSYLAKLRNQVRLLHITHRYLRGRTYRGCESKTHNRLSNEWVARIEFLANLYGGPLHGDMPPVSEWVKAN